MKPWVAPEKRPSVINATLSQALTDQSGGDSEHLSHPRAARRALAADHNHVALGDLLGEDGRHCRLLAVKDTGRAHVTAALVAGELDDASIRCDVAPQDRKAAAGLEGI